ncbi:MAG: hypothetical protein O2967_14675 [Proteobacteria bacterium]|nr:hypothetical protein [Pseudomonadota bacterium]
MESTASHLKIYNFRVSADGQHVAPIRDEYASSDAGDEIHRLTARLMAETGERDYRTAMHRVLDQNPGLKRDYAS